MKGQLPACVEVCPRQAVVYGGRDELLAEARRRIAADPARYNPRVFGEHDAGGTQVLYLAPHGVSFAELGLPELGERSMPDRVHGVQGLIYKGFVGPARALRRAGHRHPPQPPRGEGGAQRAEREPE